MKKFIQYTFLLLFVLGSVQMSNAAFIRRGKLKKRSVSSWKPVVVVGKKVGDIATATATIAAKEKESPQPGIKAFDLKASTNKKGNYELTTDIVCERGICLFKQEEDPIGHTYTLTLTFKDKDGKQVGSPESVDVVLELDKICATNIKIKEITLKNLNLYYPKTAENKTSDMLITTQVDQNEKDIDASINWSIEYAEDKNLCSQPTYTVIVEYSEPDEDAAHTYSTQASYDAKTKKYSAKWPKVKKAYTYSFWIKPTGTRNGWKVNFNDINSITNTSIALGTKKRNEEDDDSNNPKDSTTNDYVINQDVKLESKVIGKIQTLSLSEIKVTNNNKLSKEIPSAKAIIYLKACDGKKVNISITLKYDSKSKTFIGSQSLPLCNSKAYDVESISVTVWDNKGTLWTRSELTHL